MSDNMSDKRSCEGCFYQFLVADEEPCFSCKRVFAHKDVDFYKVKTEDVVKKPKHYMLCGIEAKDIIELIMESKLCNDMSRAQLGYFYNVMKYRLRAGKKDSTEQDIGKALEYESMWERYFD